MLVDDPALDIEGGVRGVGSCEGFEGRFGGFAWSAPCGGEAD